jgi:hypothetical protein
MDLISWKRYAKDKIYERNCKKSAKQIWSKSTNTRLRRKSARCSQITLLSSSLRKGRIIQAPKSDLKCCATAKLSGQWPASMWTRLLPTAGTQLKGWNQVYWLFLVNINAPGSECGSAFLTRIRRSLNFCISSKLKPILDPWNRF